MARPVKPDAVKKAIQHYVDEFTKAAIVISKGDKGAVQKHVCDIWPDSDQRHRCVGWLFNQGPIHMATLTDAQFLALKRWIGAIKVENEWLPAKDLTTEAEWIDWSSLPQPQEAPKNTMLNVDGVTIKCPDCGANVFTKIDETHYSCNGCRAEYVGESADPEAEESMVEAAIALGGVVTDSGKDPDDPDLFTFD